MADYPSTSPYFNTPIEREVLGLMVNRFIPKEPDDVQFEITEAYNLRPDLLSFDLYGRADLWWVFAQRNPNTLVDPLNDFVSGKTIFLPKQSVLKQTLGF